MIDSMPAKGVQGRITPVSPGIEADQTLPTAGSQDRSFVLSTVLSGYVPVIPSIGPPNGQGTEDLQALAALTASNSW